MIDRSTHLLQSFQFVDPKHDQNINLLNFNFSKMKKKLKVELQKKNKGMQTKH